MATQQELCLAAAQEEAEKSPHPRVKIGMVLTYKGEIIGRGYNAPPKGAEPAPAEEPKRDSYICAERHGIDDAYRNMSHYGLTTLEGTEAYITCPPCKVCAEQFALAGVKVVNVPATTLSKASPLNLKDHWVESIKKGKVILKRSRIKLNYI